VRNNLCYNQRELVVPLGGGTQLELESPVFQLSVNTLEAQGPLHTSLGLATRAAN